ncbi:tyrosine-sulfated glycopeptide receptor 1-like [Gastrolobium bilobum]|uniref:tyrosine-sulfated glycopeptide receptor 1-like n=1 Tax=Gastrolobium bilobum TaxID=150636 RepID=UPI002AB100F4|nr:tyrosine-sulfated glycopeptide receptor 1-like [Gastrolobium bilobum]
MTPLCPLSPSPSSSCFMRKDHNKDSIFTFFVSVVLMTKATQKPTTRSTPSTSTPSHPSSAYYYMVSKLMVPFIIVQLLILSLLVVQVSSCNQIEKDSLLAFSSNISTSLPYPSLNWSTSADCCLWEGITCDGDLQVTHLLLPSRGLTGFISSSLIGLTSLSHLNLSHNRLSGNLQHQFFSLLNHLLVLDLSYNRLSGELPPFVADNSSSNSSVSVIQKLDLSSNSFNGALPSSLLQKLAGAAAGGSLISFNVSNNSFTGQIPTSLFCINDHNSSSLRFLDYSSNGFDGTIQPGLGACSKLEIFRAGFNFLTGTIPSDIFEAVSLTEISLPLNKLSGTIGDGIVNLANLTVLELYSNYLTGPIHSDIGKLSKLEQLLLHVNNLTGTLPPSLMNCVNLVVLNLRVNKLEGNLSVFNFSGFLRLATLDLGNNNFTGVLPPTLYACKSLAAVRLAFNQLEGQISPEILGLESLSFLAVSSNNLRNVTGALRILTGLKKLSTLMLSKNFYNEMIPSDVNLIGPDEFQNLQVLSLGGCNLTGQIPDWLVNLKKLEALDLSYNQISGSIPPLLGTLPQLFYIDLSFNLLTGIFPTEFTRLPTLTSQQAYNNEQRTYLELPVFANANNVSQMQYNQLSSLPPAIYLGSNHLNGSIPIEIGQLKVLHQLDLKSNNFSGNIPVEISNLTNLEKLDLSRNHLSGDIPDSLKRLHFLSFFSVAYNNFQGQIPSGGQFDTFSSSSFEGNPQLCGSIIQHPCSSQQNTNSTAASHRPNRKAMTGLIIAACFGISSMMTVLVIWLLSKRKVNPGGVPEKIELESISAYSNSGVHPEVDKEASVVVLFPNKTIETKDLTIFEILKATENFSQANIIGCGGFGLVYKATLPNGTTLAIKKLSGDLGLMEREFKAEVEALSTAQHENLVALQGYCVHNGFRLLMYTYMENGSLDYWLHEKADGASQLDWPTRLKIAQGASGGLAYLHQICEPHIVHRDIKSSNILLDEKFEAHVADFGLSRLILPYHTHVTTELVGTLGYIPPEYGQAWVATLRGDVYSFGVVMLELLTGRRPIDVCKPKMSRELVAWIHQMRSEGKQDQVFDPLLRGKGFEGEMLQVLDVACMCVSHNPFKRPTIREVVEWLKNVGSANQHRNND